MKKNLLDLSTEDLLNKFGAGNHKPGSGSAAAFQAMLSAKLLVTVISLTNEEKRRANYSDSLPTLLQMQAVIMDRIFPELTFLFQEDSIQFGKTIEARKARDRETNVFKRNELGRQALNDLKIAIEIPLNIAELGTELAKIAEFTFDNGFQSARGDTQVALSSAVASIGSCLSIVHLNLLSYGIEDYDWIEKIRIKTSRLRLSFNHSDLVAASKIDILEGEVRTKADLFQNLNNIHLKPKEEKYITDKDIENCVVKLQLLIWKNREKIWSKEIPKSPIDILKPNIIFKNLLGYSFHKQDDLGLSDARGTISDIAGLIDQEKRVVLISNQFPVQIQSFTAAHELGHAILHKQSILHRDLPIDGTEQRKKRPLTEKQADRFATFFLMPGKQVIKEFQERFLTDKFIIDDNTAFNLNQTKPSKLAAECQDLRGLCRKLTEAESFAGTPFISLAKLFNVSVEALAIRLEELNLVEF
ncbi:MAG: cyclodeaminase/cyclohydrolase family protein [Pseudosphingobacterium sp.]|nr:cyclodeaminase/cyclohydrolase family protein [Pseudosphingobacterium sp.]